MFWQNFVSLCNKKGVSPNGVCAELGLSNATATKWKNGSTPRGSTLKKLVDYFGVTTDYLLGNEKKEPSTTLDPRLLSLLDSMTEEELADLEQYAEFILSKKKK